MRRRASAALRLCAAVAAAALAGCATVPSPVDPLEPANRVLFEVHEVADKYVMKPVVTPVPTKTPGRVGVTPEIPEVPGISTTGASLFLPGGAPVRANMTSEYPEHRPTRSPRKGVPTKSTPSQGSTDASEKGTDDSSASDDEADDK